MRLNKQDHEALALWAADCAKHVLPYFEEHCPKDDRPRKAIEAGRAWANGELKMSEARAATIVAHAAARDTDQAAARAAARATGHTAATAHMAAHAPHAATYAADPSYCYRKGTRLAVPTSTRAPSASSVSLLGQ